jgi:hypothetical protein
LKHGQILNRNFNPRAEIKTKTRKLSSRRVVSVGLFRSGIREFYAN